MNESMEAMSESVDPRYLNRQSLLEWAKAQLDITDEDMNDPSVVNAKIRNAKIEKVIED